MKISEQVYKKIISTVKVPPPEMGGILGGIGDVIDKVEFDYGMKSNGYEYIPNTEYLNIIINTWSNNGHLFMGIFHSHFPRGYSLSENDKIYIRLIMESINIDKLYFPIVIPNDKIIAYYAILKNGKTIIKKDNVEIIKEEEVKK